MRQPLTKLNSRAVNWKIAVAALIAAAVFIGAIVTKNLDHKISGFAVLEDARAHEDSNLTTGINETNHEDSKEKGMNDAKEEKLNVSEEIKKPEKDKEKNTPPFWNSETDEFTLSGKYSIDLSQYFSDAENDSLAYLFTTPKNIEVIIGGSIVTLIPKEHNFTAAIEFTATDGDRSATKKIKLIVPEKSITINLRYGHNPNYDPEDDGYEPTTGIIDMTVEDSVFSWDVNESKLCTKWKIAPHESEESTAVCYGSKECCNFAGLNPSRDAWNEPFYSVYGQYGTGAQNAVSAQVIYADYGLSIVNPFAEIYLSQQKSLGTGYYFASVDFENVCVETCTLSGFSEAGYKIVFEIENAVLNLDTLTYFIAGKEENVMYSVGVKDSNGIISGSHNLYKNNAIVPPAEFIEPGFYDIHAASGDTSIKLVMQSVNITKPLTADIGIDNITKEIRIENADAIKEYAINLGNFKFNKAILTSIAEANSLYQCKQWDYGSEVCFGEWVKIKNLIASEYYSLELGAESSGFIEGNSNFEPVNSSNLTLINETNLTMANITNLTFSFEKSLPNITLIKNRAEVINLSEFVSDDAETLFNYFKPDNISIFFNDSTALIVPDASFTGIGFSYIIANKSGNIAVSNVFSISVLEVRSAPLAVSGKIINITDPLMHKSLVEYAETNLKPAFRYSNIQFVSYQVTNDVVIVYILIDGKESKWLTSLNNFNSIITK